MVATTRNADMTTKSEKVAGAESITLSIRLRRGERNTLGPGKFALLEAIATEGSITGAARKLGMSYRRAWLLVEALNEGFADPVVHASHGGRSGGGAALTEAGEEALALYRRIEVKAAQASTAERRALDRLLRH